MAKTNIPNLPLKLAKGIEQDVSWERIQTPHDFLRLAAQLLVVDVEQISTLEEVVVSPTEPTGQNRKAIWVKSEQPFAVNIKAGSQYAAIYQYPPNVPMLWTKGEDNVPSYMRRLTAAEMTKMSLAQPSDSFYFYVIFDL